MAIIVDEYKIGKNSLDGLYVRIKKESLALAGTGDIVFSAEFFGDVSDRIKDAVPFRTESFQFKVSSEELAAKPLFKLAYDKLKEKYPDSSDAAELVTAKEPKITDVVVFEGKCTVKGTKDKNTYLEYYTNGTDEVKVKDEGKTFILETSETQARWGLFIATSGENMFQTAWKPVEIPEKQEK